MRKLADKIKYIWTAADIFLIACLDKTANTRELSDMRSSYSGWEGGGNFLYMA